jgi:hypothetical protein
MAPQYLPGEPSTQSRPPVYAAQDVPYRQAPHTFQGPGWVRRAREDMSGQSTSRRSLPDNPPIHLHLFPRRSGFGGDQPFIPNNRQLTQPENLRRTSDSLRQNQEHLQEPKCNAAGYYLSTRMSNVPAYTPSRIRPDQIAKGIAIVFTILPKPKPLILQKLRSHWQMR